MRVSVRLIKIATLLFFLLIVLISAGAATLHFGTGRVVESVTKESLTLKSATWKRRSLGFLHSYIFEFVDANGKVYKGESMTQFGKVMGYEPCFDFYEYKKGQAFEFEKESGYFTIPLYGKMPFESNFENNMMYIACKNITPIT